jgi:hypothetical protein
VDDSGPQLANGLLELVLGQLAQNRGRSSRFSRMTLQGHLACYENEAQISHFGAASADRPRNPGGRA